MVSQLSKTSIIYPECDGKPMADNTKQFRWILTIQQNIDWLYANDPQVFVAGDLLWYPIEGQTETSAAPDTMVVFGRPKGDRSSYKQWEEANIAPQVVFEILSPSNKALDMAKKLVFYDRHRVEEYYVYDPERDNLEIWIRSAGSLDRIPETHNWISPLLGIRFDLSADEMQICRPDGTKFYSYIEINTMLEQARLRAEQATQKLADMEAMLKQYRDRFGELPQ